MVIYTCDAEWKQTQEKIGRQSWRKGKHFVAEQPEKVVCKEYEISLIWVAIPEMEIAKTIANLP